MFRRNLVFLVSVWESLVTTVFALVCILLINVLSPAAKKIGLVDVPTKRKDHSHPVPTVGGIAIYLALMIATLVLEMPPSFIWIIAVASTMVIIGALDDAFGLSVRVRLFWQLVSTVAVVIGAQLWVSYLGLGLQGLGSLNYVFGSFITVVSIIGLINAFNMVDGIDGLASGQILVSIGCLSLIILILHGPIVELRWLYIMFVVVMAFWIVNMSFVPIEKVFLGDAGSLSLGFILAFLLIYFSQPPVSMIKPSATLWLVTLPVYDAIRVISSRLHDKQSPFGADRRHLHHIFIDRGWSPSQVLLLILPSSMLVNLLGLWLAYTVPSEATIFIYVLCFVGFSCGVKKLENISSLRR